MKKTVFDDEFVSSLSDDNVEACLQVVSQFQKLEKDNRKGGAPGIPPLNYYEYLEIHAFLLLFIEIRAINIHLNPPTFDAGKDVVAVKTCVSALESLARSEVKKRKQRDSFELALSHYPTLMSKAFSYEFLESDYKRIQELISELRTLTTESEQIDGQHKRRLLKRIEKLQLELSMKMSNMDIFWGLFGEAGVALGKFGTDVKPLTDRICEVLKIAARTEARANGLPEGIQTPLLKAVSDISEQSNE
jgi:hypothetical protein